jgi:hypothetical protein
VAVERPASVVVSRDLAPLPRAWSRRFVVVLPSRVNLQLLRVVPTQHTTT